MSIEGFYKIVMINFVVTENKADQLAILQEAAVVKCEGRSATLRKQTDGDEVTRDQIIVSLFADLQQLQETEIANFLNDMQDMVRSKYV